MMKTTGHRVQWAAGLTFLLLTLTALTAFAGELPFRAGIRMAFQVPTKKASREGMDSFIGGGGDIGLSVMKHLDLSAGVEYIQGRNDNTFAVYDQQGNILDSGVLNESALSGLLSLRWCLWDKATPYFGVGAGGSRLTWKVVGFRENANAPVMEALAGYEFATSEHFRLDLDLRFRSQRADVDWGGVPNDISGIQFSVGSRYNW
jgi:opacity protein-like surface antigen